MFVTYPVQTPSMHDAIEMAKRMALAAGYKMPILMDAKQSGAGQWMIKLQVSR